MGQPANPGLLGKWLLKLSGTVYCYQSYLCVCNGPAGGVFVCVCWRYHGNSKLHASILTKLCL